MLLRIITSIDSDIDLYRSLIIPLIVYNNVLNVNRSVLIPLVAYNNVLSVNRSVLIPLIVYNNILCKIYRREVCCLKQQYDQKYQTVFISYLSEALYLQCIDFYVLDLLSCRRCLTDFISIRLFVSPSLYRMNAV